MGKFYLDRYQANVPILNPLKTPESLWFSGVFRGYKTRTLVRNGLLLPLSKEPLGR